MDISIFVFLFNIEFFAVTPLVLFLLIALVLVATLLALVEFHVDVDDLLAPLDAALLLDRIVHELLCKHCHLVEHLVRQTVQNTLYLSLTLSVSTLFSF